LKIHDIIKPETDMPLQHLTSAAPSVADAANNTMFKVNNWFLANKLSLNTDKTFYMVFPPDTLLQTSSQSSEKFPQAKKLTYSVNVNPLNFVNRERKCAENYNK